MDRQTHSKPIIRKINRGNQVTLPPRFIASQHLHAGDPIEMIEEGDRLILRAPFSRTAEKKKAIKKIHAIFAQMNKITDKPTSSLSEEAIMKSVDQEIDALRNPQ